MAEPCNKTTRRSPYDGKPYYCVICDAGLGEYMACEELECELESEASAVARMNCVSEEEAANG